jgi:DNA-binding CsgD family transcriptional regulator
MTEDEGSPGGERGLAASERGVLAAVLALIAVLALADLAGDLREGVTPWHVLAEGAVVVAACVGVALLLRGAWALKHRLADQSRDFSAFREQAEAWRADSRRHVEGLSRAIDRQLDQWQLSAAEKDVAFLLLKGLSLKEIAAARGTSEKTVRAQSVSVYAKSGLTGRPELSAFFLEDLLPPALPPGDRHVE